MAQKRNTFIGGMDQDTSKSKQDGSKYYRGVNIKVITEEGLSSGNIENEDGNLLSFSIPDTLGFWRIKFTAPEDPQSGTLQIDYTDPITNLATTFPTPSVDNIEDLVAQLNSGLAALLGTNVKIIKNGEFVYIIPLDSTITAVRGYAGLSTLAGGAQETKSFHVEAQTGLKIIGWTTLRDEIIMFTTNDSSQVPDSAGQIWKFKYDPLTNTIENINNGSLTLADHLIYNNKLNFSTYWHIGNEPIGHYENTKTGRVYWTDEYNPVRVINALDPDLLGRSPGDLEINSQVDMSLPTAQYVTTGGSLPNGAVMQYAYRLITVGGVESPFSPVSNPTPLGSENPLSDAQDNRAWEFNGSTSTTGDKAVVLDIQKIDTSFDFIELIAIQTIANTTSIYKFTEVAVPSDGNLSITHTGGETPIPITEEEFAALTRTFKRCKTLTVKDKRLIVANVDTQDTKVEGWDSRAYRFKGISDPINPRTALLNDTELSPVTINGANPDYTLVPDEHDCINPYNKEKFLFSDGVANTANQYKFKADGVTLGGEGANISYEFITEDISLKASLTGGGSGGYAPFGVYNTIHYNRFSGAPYFRTTYKQLNGEDRVGTSEYQSFMSPTMHSTYTGYARGEVYRVGIVFYDKGGNPFNTKWIGDIKIPEATEPVNGQFPYAILSGTLGNDSSDASASVVTSVANGQEYDWNYPVKGQSIGIRFNVDVSDLLDSISGYEIVRVKRREQDKTRLGTGIMTNFGLLKGSGFFGRRADSSATTGGSYAAGGVPLSGSAIGVTDSDNIEINGDDTGKAVISDAPIFHFTGGLDTMAVISPITILKSDSGYGYKTGDSLRTLGWYKDFYEGGDKYIARNSSGKIGNTSDRNFAAYNILGREWSSKIAHLEERTVEKERQIGMGEVLTSADWTGPSSNPVNLDRVFMNTSPASNGAMGHRKQPAGLGGQKQVVDLGRGNRFNFYSPITGRDIRSYPNALPTISAIPSINEFTSYAWREVSYDRVAVNQYGGDTFEARAGNAYISTGTFEQIKDYFPGSRTIDMYGGDVYVNMFHYEFYELNYDAIVTGFGYDVGETKYHLGFAFPVESPINLDYMDAGHYGGEGTRNWLSGDGNFDSVGQNGYSIGDHYQKQNDVKQVYYPAGFYDNTVEEFPHRIWASNNKLDGELIDSWRVFLPNNYTEVEGQYGQINKITTLQDKFFFFQDRAMGVASINDRSVINDENGVALTLGSGGILDDYGYISRNSGTKHKFSVVPTGNTIHYFDILLKKWMRFSGGNQPLSDVKGLHSHFLKIDGNALVSDRILEGKGIHGIFDRVRNKVYMTFLGARASTNTEPANGVASASLVTATASEGGSSGGGISLGSGSASDILNTSSTTNYTLMYNENTQGYIEFIDHIPYLWLETDGRVLSTDNNLKKGYLAYEGNKNTFFGVTYPSVIELIISPTADITSVFDTIEYKSEIFINDVDQPTLTFDSIQAINDHQDTGVIPLTVGGNVIRKLRSWRTNIPRDASTNNPRMRDYFIKLILIHTPTNNERLVLHDIITNYRVTPH